MGKVIERPESSFNFLVAEHADGVKITISHILSWEKKAPRKANEIEEMIRDEFINILGEAEEASIVYHKKGDFYHLYKEVTDHNFLFKTNDAAKSFFSKLVEVDGKIKFKEGSFQSFINNHEMTRFSLLETISNYFATKDADKK